jgi:uncharacterized Ntn-hydrolase superfamily protein
MDFSQNILFNTYSIVARDAQSGDFGVAVQTHQMCVGVAVPWLKAGIGAVATQSLTNLSFGPMGLVMLEENVPAPKIVEALVASDEGAKFRQLAVVDRKGGVGAFTGGNCIPEASHYIGDGYSVQANMMANDSVVPAMAETYEATSGDLASRMMAAMHAAQKEGGDIRGMQSAALVVVSGEVKPDGSPSDRRPIYDLRVDEHETPLLELDRLVRLRSAQIISDQGYKALEEGNIDEALEIWERACAQAPELEEMPFWQAITLADEHTEFERGLKILEPMLSQNPLRDQWIDLIRRCQSCGVIETEGVSDRLISGISKNQG